MSVKVEYTSNVTATETIQEGVPAATDANLKHGGYDARVTSTGSTTPPVSMVATFEQALTDGAATIDLTALPHRGIVVDGTGLRVQYVKVRGKVGNTGPISIAKGAVDGYDGFGDPFAVELGPSLANNWAELTLRTQDHGSDIGPTNKTLDLAGTGTDVAQIIVALG